MSKHPVVRRKETKLIIEHVTARQFAELLGGMRAFYGGRIKDCANKDGAHEICFASTLEKRKKNALGRINLRRSVEIFADEQEEFMKQAKAVAALLLRGE